jgi:hypothetical protein
VTGNFVPPDAWGSGKFGTPFERMHWEKASNAELVDPPAVDEPPEPFSDLPAFNEPPEPVDDGLPLHAAASRTKAAVAITADAVRAVGGRARRGRRMTRVPWFIMPCSGLGEHAGRPAGPADRGD